MKIKNFLLLLLTALIWGVAFVAQTEGGDMVGPYTFNCIRSLMGSVTLLPVIYVLDKLSTRSCEEKKNMWTNPALIQGGILCGILLCIATNLQQLGIFYGASSGKAGFLTACYILIVPIMGLFLKRRCGWNIWLGIAFAVVGLYLLCMTESLSPHASDILILLCAVCFSGHIMVIDHFSPLVDGVRMSCIQFAVCGIITAIPMIFMDMIPIGFANWSIPFFNVSAWIPIIYAGVFSCGVAYTLQIIGQKGANPTTASLLLSLESVFAALAGLLILGQTMSLRQTFGCTLIFIAIVLAQINIKHKAQ